MFPPKCGANWLHVPSRLASNRDPHLLLGVMHCQIGGDCNASPGWWHFRPAEGWSTTVYDDEMRLIDPAGYARLGLYEQGGKFYLLPIARYRIDCRRDVFDDHMLWIAEASDQVTGQVLGRTYRIQIGLHEARNRDAVVDDLEGMVEAVYPATADALNSWD